MVRERPRRAQERAPQFDAEVHFRSPRGSTVARVVVTGPPMPGVPWRIDESNAGVLRRCAADGVCQLFVVDPSSRRVEPRQGADDDRAVFALRTTLESSATPVTVLAVQRRAGATAVVIGATPQGLESPSLGGSLQGVFFENDELGFWLRDRDGRLHAVGGSTPTSLAPCTSGGARPFGVISQSVTLGAFGEPFELRAELARNGADRTCVTRLYGRASIRLVASSIDVTTTGQGALEGLLRTPRAVRAVRCVATGA